MKGSLLIAVIVVLFTSCHGSSDARRNAVDSLNSVAYAWRYRDVERSRQIATETLAQAEAGGYAAGQAEALNHLAYERFWSMDFDSAMALAQKVIAMKATSVEKIAAHVMAMKVAQRTSQNVAFFAHRSQAEQLLANTYRRDLNPHELSRLDFAEGEMHIVASTYFFYVDQLERAQAEIAEAEHYCQMAADTAQWLYYNYMLGSGGLIESVDDDDVTRQEFDHLFKCFTFSKNHGYLYFEANALQSLAIMLADSTRVAALQQHKPEALIYLGILFPEPMTETMAHEAMTLFSDYGDNFQRACALRTLGTLAARGERYDEALYCYHEALTLVADKPVYEWEASILEQMSVAYAGVGDIVEAARTRNAYLDLRERTREDAEMENRLTELQQQSQRLRRRIIATCLLAALLVTLVMLFRHWWLRRNAAQLKRVRQARQNMIDAECRRRQELADAEEELREQQAATRLRIERDKCQNIVQRAKLSLARDIVPLLDRIIHSTRQMLRRGEPSTEGLEYIRQLTERIDELGAMLTDWIQLERGRVALKVTTFPLQPIMETLRHSHHAFEQKGIELTVPATTLSVKADRALTLFMLNTLADNARKFTDAGGHVEITATEGKVPEGEYVELAVTDDGRGIDTDAPITPSGHGFGLTNCRGIIERYRKTSAAFAVCQMGVDSECGRGSRFWFRLPRAAVMLMLLFGLNVTRGNAHPGPAEVAAYRFADSLYYANIDGRHDDALIFADSALAAISRWHVELYPSDTAVLALNPSGTTPPELRWLMRGDTIDFEMLIAMRNETAIAALATRHWDMYANNNNVYTRLYKLYNRDARLEADCAAIERSQQQQRMTLWLMAALLIAAAVATYAFYLRPRMLLRRALTEMRRQHFNATIAEEERRRVQQQTDVEMAEDEHRRRLFEENRLHVQNQVMDNVLSTIKHETMYYPGRIARLAERIDTVGKDTDASTQLTTLMETATYYHDVYTTLIAAAEDAVAQTPFRITNVALGNDLHVRADADLTEMLTMTLREAVQAMAPTGNISIDTAPTTDGHFVRYAVTNDALNLDETERNELFAPRRDETKFLVCKQIVRETDTLLGHVGCRIQADPAISGTTVWFTLPKL